MTVQQSGNNQPDRANELEDAKCVPCTARQCTEGRYIRAHLVEHEHLHHARRDVEERAEDLENPQESVHHESNSYSNANGCSMPCPTADVPPPFNPVRPPVADPATTE